MRTDHVTAWLIKQWLVHNAPQVSVLWPLEVEDQVKGFVEKLKSLIPDAESQAIVQHVISRSAIEQWGLRDVALLGGGTPTPLSPRPDQIRYFTDSSAEVIAEAAQRGYNTRQVNVTNAAELKQLEGATTAVATGLVHFLPEPAAQMVFNGLAEAGFHTIVFNHANPGFSAEVIDQYSKLGIIVRFRTPDQIQALLPAHWKIEQVMGAPEVVQHADGVGPSLASLPALFDVYRVVKA